MTQAQFDHFVAQALQLPYEQRCKLVDQLQDSLHPPGEDISEEEWIRAWILELRRRMEATDAGETGIPFEEALKRIAGKHA